MTCISGRNRSHETNGLTVSTSPRIPGTWIEDSGPFLAIRVTRDLYPTEVAIRACYDFLDRAHLLLTSAECDRPNEYRILIRARDGSLGTERLASMALDLCNALIDHQLRRQVDEQTGDIRKLIVAQAFAEVDLFSEDSDPGH